MIDIKEMIDVFNGNGLETDHGVESGLIFAIAGHKWNFRANFPTLLRYLGDRRLSHSLCLSLSYSVSCSFSCSLPLLAFSLSMLQIHADRSDVHDRP